MAEIEFSVLSRCCLKQRLPDEDALRREVQAPSLVKERNTANFIPIGPGFPRPPSNSDSTPKTPEPSSTASILSIPNMTEY